MASRSTRRPADAFWRLDATAAAPSQRSEAQAALDAAPELLYAQVVKTVRRRRLVGVQHRVVFGTLDGRRAGPVGVWPADQYGVCRGATRWSKGSLGFRVDREVIINLVTQFSMRVQIPPSRCRSDSVSPRPATGPQRSEAGINGGPWQPHAGYPV